MIDGQVTADREVVVSIVVYGPTGIFHRSDFVLDTGFTGYLTLTTDEIAALELRTASDNDFRFADGRTLTLTTYRAIVDWDGAQRRIVVMPLEEVHLLGMHLLSGSVVTFEATINGIATIDTGVVDGFDAIDG